MKSKIFIAIIAIVSSFIFSISTKAQTASFTFQGKLNDGGAAANNTYQFEFKLFDAATGGNQIGSTITDLPATVSNGIFTVKLDFGANSFDGAARFLEIAVRLNGSGQNYTTLTPRQPITSAPYAVKSLNADSATNATNAGDSNRLGGLTAAQYTRSDDARLSDARTPTPFSTYYIQNGASLQTNSAFNISGEGKANVFSAATQFNIGGARVLAIGNGNLFVGFETGRDDTSGGDNSFVGAYAGQKNTTGNFNSFFGYNAGQNNLDGSRNSFFGVNSGLGNTTGAENSFFGLESGYNNSTGGSNAFFGAYAGKATTEGSSNSFFGRSAGEGNTTGASNSFFGLDAGRSNQTGDFNAFFGRNAGRANVSRSLLAFFGTNAGLNNTTGDGNSFFGGEAGMYNVSGSSNAFFGISTGKENTTGLNNSFFGAYAGRDNQTGGFNSFFGATAGLKNAASFNSFFGNGAGLNNSTGAKNAFFGYASGGQNTIGANNSFYGSGSGAGNTTGENNTFIGISAGAANGSGSGNTFVGALTDAADATGSNNTALGYNNKFGAGVNNSIAVGANLTVSQSNTVQIGGASDNVQLGNVSANAIHGTSISGTGGKITGAFQITGKLTAGSLAVGDINAQNNYLIAGGVTFGSLSVGGSTPLCSRPSGVGGSGFYDIVNCSSSIRYKENVQNFTRGFDLIEKLRPVTFNWKFNGAADVGFIAEEVNQTEPLLTVFNGAGQIEGVKYAQITTALVNAVKEQQAQIESERAENQNLQDQIKRQQTQINELKTLICTDKKTAAICQPNK